MTVIARDDVTLELVTDVASTSHYFQLQASTASAPTAPTVYPAPSPWVTTEPAYTEGATNSLYTVDVTVFSDGSFDYTPVSLSSSYEAAKAAYNKARQAQSAAQGAQTTADGKNKIFSSASEPSHMGIVPGDLWFQLDSNGNVTGIQVWNGSAFTDMVLVANKLLVASSVGTTQIADNAITTGKMMAGSVTAVQLASKSVTADKADIGSLAAAIVSSNQFKTSNGRMLINDDGLTAKDASGNTTVDIPSDGSTPTMVGGFSTASSGRRITVTQDSNDSGMLALRTDDSVLAQLTMDVSTFDADGYVRVGLGAGQSTGMTFNILADSKNHSPDPRAYDIQLTSADGDNGKIRISGMATNVQGTWFADSKSNLPTRPNIVGGSGKMAFAGGVDYVFDGAGAWSRRTPRMFRYTITHMMGASAGDAEWFEAVSASTLLSDLGHPITGQYAAYVTYSACVQDNGMVRAMSVDNNGAINIRTISNGPGLLRFGITVMDWN